jgi:hypothetical protein
MASADDSSREQEILLDGVVYKIQVSADGGRYSASWTCTDCRGFSKSTVWGDSIDEAMEQARVVLMDHHARIHRDSRSSDQAAGFTSA